MSFDPRASVREGLAAGIGVGPRRAKAAPSPAPAGPEASPPSSHPRSGPSPTTGVRRGSRRIMDLGLSSLARSVFDSGQAGATRGDVLVAAISETHELLRQRFAPPPSMGPFAGTATVRRKRAADPDRKDVIVSVSAGEAEVIARLAAETTLSVAGYCDEALKLVAEMHASR